MRLCICLRVDVDSVLNPVFLFCLDLGWTPGHRAKRIGSPRCSGVRCRRQMRVASCVCRQHVDSQSVVSVAARCCASIDPFEITCSGTIPLSQASKSLRNRFVWPAPPTRITINKEQLKRAQCSESSVVGAAVTRVCRWRPVPVGKAVPIMYVCVAFLDNVQKRNEETSRKYRRNIVVSHRGRQCG